METSPIPSYIILLQSQSKKCEKLKFNLLLECLLPYTHPIIYAKYIGSGIQNTVKPNKLLSVMTVCRHGFHNGVMAYMLQFD